MPKRKEQIITESDIIDEIFAKMNPLPPKNAFCMETIQKRHPERSRTAVLRSFGKAVKQGMLDTGIFIKNGRLARYWWKKGK